MVIRIPFGGGIGGVEHHSDSSEAYYAHTPGLRVVTPGTPADAYRLLRQAISCPDPVIFLEPKRRYWSKETAVLTPEGPPMDRAVVRRPGKDVTLVAYGGMVATALEAAEAMSKRRRNACQVRSTASASVAARDDHSHSGSGLRSPGRWPTASRIKVPSTTGSSPSWPSHPARRASCWCSLPQAMAAAVPYLLVSVTVVTAGAGQVA